MSKLNCTMYSDDIVLWTSMKNNKKEHHYLLEGKISKVFS